MRLQRKQEKISEDLSAVCQTINRRQSEIQPAQIRNISKQDNEIIDDNTDEIENKKKEAEMREQIQAEITHQYPTEIKAMEAFEADHHQTPCNADYCNDEEEVGEACDGNEHKSHEDNQTELTGSTKDAERETKPWARLNIRGIKKFFTPKFWKDHSS